MYYTHPGYQTSIFGKNSAYYTKIFTVAITIPLPTIVHQPTDQTDSCLVMQNLHTQTEMPYRHTINTKL